MALPIVAGAYDDLRRVLAAGAVAILVAALFVVVVEEGRTVTVVAVPTPATTHLLVTPTSSQAVVGRSTRAALAVPLPVTTTSLTVPTRRPSGTVAPIAAVPAPPAPRSLSPPAPTATPPAPTATSPALGTYPYRYEVSDGSTGGTTVGSLTVSRGPVPNEEAETERIDSDVRERTVRWTSSAATLMVSTDDGVACAWSGGLVGWSLPLAVGRSWSTSSGCSIRTPQGQPGTQALQETAKVVGSARTTVGGAAVNTWVIERHTVVTEQAAGVTVTSESETSELFDPQSGLVVYQVGRTAAPNADGTVSTTSTTIELLDTHPSG